MRGGMVAFYDWVSLETIHAPRFDKRFVRTPMGIYYVPKAGAAGFKVSEDEMAEVREDARELLRAAEVGRPRFAMFTGFVSIYALIVPAVLFTAFMSMLGLGEVVMLFLLPMTLLNLAGPTILHQIAFQGDWRRFKQATDARFGSGPRAEFALIAPYFRRNPVEIVSWWLTWIAVSMVVGLMAASIMLDDVGEDQMMRFVGDYVHLIGIVLVALFFGTLAYDRYFGTHADPPPQGGNDLTGQAERRRKF